MHPRSVFPQSSENLNPNLSPLTAALCWGNSVCNMIVISVSHFWLGRQSESFQICNEITKHWSTTWMSRSVFFVSFWQEMKSESLDLRNSLTSLLYGSSVGHWLIKGIERFLLRSLGSHGIKLVLSHVTQNVLLSIKRRSRELTYWMKSGVLSSLTAALEAPGQQTPAPFSPAGYDSEVPPDEPSVSCSLIRRSAAGTHVSGQAPPSNPENTRQHNFSL